MFYSKLKNERAANTQQNNMYVHQSINQVVNARVAGSITPYSVEDRHVLLFIIVGCLSIVYLLHIFLSLVVGSFSIISVILLLYWLIYWLIVVRLLSFFCACLLVLDCIIFINFSITFCSVVVVVGSFSIISVILLLYWLIYWLIVVILLSLLCLFTCFRMHHLYQFFLLLFVVLWLPVGLILCHPGSILRVWCCL